MSQRDPLPDQGDFVYTEEAVSSDDVIAHGRRWKADRDRYREALLAAKDELSGEHDFDADVRAGVLRQITAALDERQVP